MAWIDDRIWCHPKVVGLSAGAYRAMVNAIAYSSGFNLHGTLEPSHQKAVGSDAKIRRELCGAELWDDVDGNAIHIHDWDDHNGKRDERKQRERERVKQWREQQRTQNGTRTETRTRTRTDPVRERTPYRDDRVTSEGSDGNEGPTTSPTPLSKEETPLQDAAPWEGKLSPDIGRENLLIRLTAAIGGGEQNRRKIDNALRRYTISEADLAQTIEAVSSPTTRDRVAIALSELAKRRRKRVAA